MLSLFLAAEFRGGNFQKFGREPETGDDSEMDSDDGRASSPTPGRIIVLGDGKTYLSEEAETDHEHLTAHPEVDYDDVQPNARIAEQKREAYKREDYFGKSTPKREREETPAPQPQDSNKKEDSRDETALSLPGHITSPDNAKRISESAIPEKLVSPAKT